jgi:hypothetical protein
VFDDCNGYTPLAHDLKFLGLSKIPGLKDCFSQQCPLGMTLSQFANFQDSLKQALLRDGLSLSDCDVRLKGSSAAFYSGWHKLMPYDREILSKVFEKSYGWPPSQLELDNIEKKIKTGWPDDLRRPIRRPFDAINRIGIIPTPTDNNLSDYDVQVSSDELAERVIAHHALVGGVLTSPHGGHYHKPLVESVCKNLGKLWPTTQANTLGRKVAVAAFPAEGPENQTAKIGHLSSHFRSTDWILI